MSFLTCFWLFPQKEHLSRSPLSPIRATCWPPVRIRSPGARCLRRHRCCSTASAGPAPRSSRPGA